MSTAGRTVLFSATTVALSMAAMLLFPMYFLKSFAYAGIATVAFAAAAAVIVTPAAIWLLGDRLGRTRRAPAGPPRARRPEPAPKPVEQLFWYRSTKFVMRRAVPIGLAVVVLLLALGAPFLGVKWGFPDDRVLPTSASAHQVGDQLRNDFVDDSSTAVTVVVPDADGLTPSDLERYAAELSRVARRVGGVRARRARSSTATRSGRPPRRPVVADGSAFLDRRQHRAAVLRCVGDPARSAARRSPGPAAAPVQLAGIAQINRDSVDAITTGCRGCSA